MSGFGAISDTITRPVFTAEFRDLDPARVPKPAGTRYKPRETAIIGMFDTSRAKVTTKAAKASPAFLTGEQAAQAARTRKPSPRMTLPYSISSRCVAALREKGDQWTPTAELVALTNRHRPEHCAEATLGNIYTALKVPRKRGWVESRPSAAVSQGLEWRIVK